MKIGTIIFVITLICSVFILVFFAGKADGYWRGFSDGIDSARSVYGQSQVRREVKFEKRVKTIDSIISIYDAQEVESFLNHSEIKP